MCLHSEDCHSFETIVWKRNLLSKKTYFKMSDWRGRKNTEFLSALEENIDEEDEENEDEKDEEEISSSFFMVWESNCRNFINEELKFSCSKAMENFQIHVFARKDTPKNATPPSKAWIEAHYTLTTCPYASDAAITAWLVQNFARYQTRSESEVVYLVFERERKYEELSAILKANNTNLRVREINGEDKTIFDVLPNVCRWCKMVFLNRSETEEHFNILHNYFCDNLDCEVKRFCNEKELQEHLERQKRCQLCNEGIFCSEKKLIAHLKETHNSYQKSEKAEGLVNRDLLCQFCPQKTFSCVEQRDIHMKNCHKKCNCSCGQFFKNRDDYLEHFYSVYPLACLENRKCPHRFQDVYYQAKHHKEAHFSISPFYCIPCRTAEEEGRKEKVSFKDEKSLRIHCAALGHEESEMFLPPKQHSISVSNLQRRVPSRTCSAINYC